MSRYYGTSDYGASGQDEPVMWLRGHAIHASRLLVLVFSVSMIATALLETFNAAGILDLFVFNSHEVLHWEIWRIFTYGLVNSPNFGGIESHVLGFLLEMAMLWIFGREMEKILGRGPFLRFFAAIYLIPPILFTALGFWFYSGFQGVACSFAFFVAFSAYYPEAASFFNLPAKWLASIFFGMYVLIYLSNHQWVALGCLLATSGFAFAYIRHVQGRFSFPSLQLFRRRPQLRVLPDPMPRQMTAGGRPKEDPKSVLDGLLDKIAVSGIDSLTKKEREALERARTEMLQNQRSGRQ